MIRIAAVGDVHVDEDVVGRYRPALDELPGRADALLIAGDLTRHGTVDEAKCFATEFGGLGVPVVVVLGNHDHQSDRPDQVTKAIEDAGIIVLESSATVLELHGHRLGIAGTKGFGGGFAGACASNFGEREMKDFVGTTERYAADLGEALRSVRCDALVALTHYAPVPETLVGEPLEIYPFLGCYQLGQAIDSAPTALALHGHAHHGSERGRTPGGVPVRNVAHPVLKQAYNVYQLLSDKGEVDSELAAIS
jgi:Icc-related predicted phosphoesterase